MPPPTAVNKWLTNRRFGVIIDAGSSGSRLLIYSWTDPRTLNVQRDGLANSLPKVEKGAADEDWVTKVEPGISSFADDPEAVSSYLAPLLKHARDHIPPSAMKDTPLFLLATAGMRLLLPPAQSRLLKATCDFLRLHSDFRIDARGADGPCGSSIRIITGEEEGLFGWIAVNYLMDGFSSSSSDRTTYGFLDMGGASTQIAFEPSAAERAKAKELVPVRLRLLGGKEIRHDVFVTTWLGYGTNQARERYVASAIDSYEKTRPADLSPEDEHVPDPCLPRDLELLESPIHLGPSPAHNDQPHKLKGTGSFAQCLTATQPLLNSNAPCPADEHCLMNGVRGPPIDFSVNHFIGVSEYWYSSQDAFGLGGSYDFAQYESAAAKFCSRSWGTIVQEHEGAASWNSSSTERPPEVDVHWGQVGNKATLPRLQYQCFKAAWIVNVLHEGLGMPRLGVDPNGKPPSNSPSGGEEVASHAQDKGLGAPPPPKDKNGQTRPIFQSADAVGDVAISWTLGKMVLEASKDVPPLNKKLPPIVDPLDDALASPGGEKISIQPIRPWDFEGIEDRIGLPSSLSRHSLGFSPVRFLFYVTLVLLLFSLAKRARRNGLVGLRKLVVGRRGREGVYAMEEGSFSRPPGSPFDMTSWSRAGNGTIARGGSAGNSRNGTMRITTARTNGFVSSSSPRGEGSGSHSPGYSTAYAASAGGVGGGANAQMLAASLSGISRSRNASQTSLVPRPMSRASTLPSELR